MHDTSPGREALIEAMRVEQARIYGETIEEHRDRLDNAGTERLFTLTAALDDGQLDEAGEVIQFRQRRAS